MIIMKDLLALLLMLAVVAALCDSSMLQPVPPSKPTLDEEMIVHSYNEDSSEDMNFECSTSAEDSMTNNSIEGTATAINPWTDGFFVQIDDEFSPDEVAVINSALYEIHGILCVGVHIWPRNSKPTGDYTFIKKNTESTACHSKVGRKGEIQYINLGVGCIKSHIIIHECIHAIGFDHEQTRIDRDSYVNIYWDNIIEGHEHNFKKNAESLTYGVPYDFGSIMQYWSYAFSKNSNLPTILKKDGGVINRNKAVTELDKLKIRKMYNCD